MGPELPHRLAPIDLGPALLMQRVLNLLSVRWFWPEDLRQLALETQFRSLPETQ